LTSGQSWKIFFLILIDQKYHRSTIEGTYSLQ
jgi:hypothetical protein